MQKKNTIPHIGLFGKRNAGKSSLINFLTGQEIAIVSNVAGTTTDPVRKTMEIKGIGPIQWIDTAGIDDKGTVGEKRIQKSMDILKSVDLALILFSGESLCTEDEELIQQCTIHKTPFLLIHSKSDLGMLSVEEHKRINQLFQTELIEINIHDEFSKSVLLNALQKAIPESSFVRPSLLGDVIHPGCTVLLVTPIDSSAPEGRLILPQVQTLRDILDNDSVAVVCKEDQLVFTLEKMKPDLVITDSQVFKTVNALVPDHIPLTSFSILLARAKGFFNEYIQGTQTIAKLKNGDRVLILESCTHHASCEDIGRIKIPQLLKKFTQKELEIEVVSGLSPIPKPLTEYSLVIQCGGCVVTQRQLAARLQPAIEAHIPVSNYGMALAFMTGIFNRSIALFQK